MALRRWATRLTASWTAVLATWGIQQEDALALLPQQPCTTGACTRMSAVVALGVYVSAVVALGVYGSASCNLWRLLTFTDPPAVICKASEPYVC